MLLKWSGHACSRLASFAGRVTTTISRLAMMLFFTVKRCAVAPASAQTANSNMHRMLRARSWVLPRLKPRWSPRDSDVSDAQVDARTGGLSSNRLPPPIYAMRAMIPLSWRPWHAPHAAGTLRTWLEPRAASALGRPLAQPKRPGHRRHHGRPPRNGQHAASRAPRSQTVADLLVFNIYNTLHLMGTGLGHSAPPSPDRSRLTPSPSPGSSASWWGSAFGRTISLRSGRNVVNGRVVCMREAFAHA
jgi:hypothetical protein